MSNLAGLVLNKNNNYFNEIMNIPMKKNVDYRKFSVIFVCYSITLNLNSFFQKKLEIKFFLA
jgi:hypothetical protein